MFIIWAGYTHKRALKKLRAWHLGSGVFADDEDNEEGGLLPGGEEGGGQGGTRLDEISVRARR